MTRKKASTTPHRGETARDAQRESTRASLIAEAVHALEAGGEQAVKVSEIANRLGISVGALYHHFENREELIVAARIAQFEGTLHGDLDGFSEIIETVGGVEEYRAAIRALVRSSHGVDRASHRRRRAEIAGVAHHHPKLAAALSAVQSDYTNRLTEVMARSQQRGLGRRDIDPRIAAVFTQTLSLGLVLDDVNTIDPIDREAWFEFADHLFDTLLAPD